MVERADNPSILNDDNMTILCKIGFIYSFCCILFNIIFNIYNIYKNKFNLINFIGSLICLFILIYSGYIFYNHCESNDPFHQIFRGLTYINIFCFILGIIIIFFGWLIGYRKKRQKSSSKKSKIPKIPKIQ